MTPHPSPDGATFSLRLGHRTAFALSTQFTTVLPLRYPLEKAKKKDRSALQSATVKSEYSIGTRICHSYYNTKN